jgi:hypothetical protein
MGATISTPVEDFSAGAGVGAAGAAAADAGGGAAAATGADATTAAAAQTLRAVSEGGFKSEDHIRQTSNGNVGICMCCMVFADQL